MLESLHVKNLALIDETEIEFTEGLNILTGETGAGKSIIIGSVNLALGAKADKDYIRTGADYALVELVFSLNERQKKVLEEMDFPVEEDRLILQRKIMPGRSVCRINGETAAAAQIKTLSASLLDMYGQHEHQTLLKASRHKEMLDSYAGNKIIQLKADLKELYRSYKKAEEEFLSNRMDENQRSREIDLLSFEIREIEASSLIPSEDEELEKVYRRMNHAKRIKEAVHAVNALTGYEGNTSAAESLGRALRELKGISAYDEETEPLIEQLTEIDNLLNDFNRSLSDYQEGLAFDEEEFVRTEERLNVLNHLKGKYGASSIEEILAGLEKKQERLQILQDYEEYLEKLEQKLKEEKLKILVLCSQISELRQESAKKLSEKLILAMKELNFAEVDFSIEVVPDEEYFNEEGYDSISFLISMNTGERKKPLEEVASGGELSRIMLALKTVFADEEGTDTLIFDEIDAGISGKTAWKVSERLGKLSGRHQIICITHLPQIAAMADSHYLIEKQIKQERTITSIQKLKEEEALEELARLLGNGNMTEAVLSNAREIKELAQKSKN